ncbi:MAG: Tetraacyldisaccharide 4-kinase [Candidatus Acidoferrum typicum]|nr:Tetraacyldisaccharide 4-kinase [Candidatus Acidoferrum typicum]
MNLPRALRILLWPLSQLYGLYVRWRAAFYAKGWLKAKRLKAKVISVGNLTVGGTGKTPMVLWLAEKFLGEGKSVAILSRGYRGTLGSSDEIELLKRRLGDKVQFGVGPDRFASGTRLESANAIDVFLLDDGFQHLQLARDLDVVMLDGSRKLKEEWLLPAGRLREPIAACRRADIVVVSRKFETPFSEARDARTFAIFYAQTRLLGFRRFGSDQSEKYLSEIGSGPFLAFCGIGNPDAFFHDLSRWHVPVADKRAFSDHHKYSLRELSQLQSRAEARGAAGLVTTEKDAENLPNTNLRLPIWIAVIDFAFTAESELLAAIDRKLATGQGAAA